MERQFLAVFAATALVLTGLVLGVNVAVDPFARWREAQPLDKEPAYTLNRRVFKLVAFDRWMAEHQGEAPSVIIGDSTANQIDADMLTQLTGRPWYSLAYGGAGLNENVELIDHLLATFPIREIVWNLPFARMVGDVEGDMPRSIAMAEEPIRHLLTYEALRGSYLVMRHDWLGIRFDDPKLDTGKLDVVTYDLSRTRTEMAGRPWPDQELAEIDRTLEVARKKGVEVLFMNPPIHPRTQSMFEQDFAQRYAQYQAFFRSHHGIDLSRPICGHAWPASIFADAEHLRLDEKHLMTEALAHVLDAAVGHAGLAAEACRSLGNGNMSVQAERDE